MCLSGMCPGGGNNPHKRSGTDFCRVYLRKHRNETYRNLRNIHGRNALGAQPVIDLLSRARTLRVHPDAALLSNVADVSAARGSTIISRPIRRRPNYTIYFHQSVGRVARDALRIPEKSMRSRLEPVPGLSLAKVRSNRVNARPAFTQKAYPVVHKANRITLAQSLRQQASSVAARDGLMGFSLAVSQMVPGELFLAGNFFRLFGNYGCSRSLRANARVTPRKSGASRDGDRRGPERALVGHAWSRKTIRRGRAPARGRWGGGA